jgi:hypothetical protein
MHKSQESAGLPVSASSSAAPNTQPALPADPSASDWVFELLSEISGHVVVVRDLLDESISRNGSAKVEYAVNVIAGLIGFLADEGMRKAGGEHYAQHVDCRPWLMSDSTQQSLLVRGAGAGSKA